MLRRALLGLTRMSSASCSGQAPAPAALADPAKSAPVTAGFVVYTVDDDGAGAWIVP